MERTQFLSKHLNEVIVMQSCALCFHVCAPHNRLFIGNAVFTLGMVAWAGLSGAPLMFILRKRAITMRISSSQPLLLWSAPEARVIPYGEGVMQAEAC
ncbi:hypothetical protein M514_26862 [Trichuris suis]|uniref:Uncharacterized protein n=1 Tax=Trichuris suis TaxID=68888 RepID=A0A085MUR8_9BILA|nr:hypothetical protein M514_26862 [Trichuris suis]